MSWQICNHMTITIKPSTIIRITLRIASLRVNAESIAAAVIIMGVESVRHQGLEISMRIQCCFTINLRTCSLKIKLHK